jgi:hypothetical protein
MKRLKIKVVLTPDAADLFPDLIVHGRGKDPRGRDIEAWERDEAARLKRLEAKRKTVEASNRPKSEAAE